MNTIFSAHIDDAEFRMFHGLGVNLSNGPNSYYLSFDIENGREVVQIKSSTGDALFRGELGANDIWCCEESSYADFINDADKEEYHVWMDMDSRKFRINTGMYDMNEGECD